VERNTTIITGIEFSSDHRREWFPAGHSPAGNPLPHIRQMAGRFLGMSHHRLAWANFLLGGLLALLLLASVGCTTAARPPGKIELSAAVFDFGEIPNSDPVSETFQVRNVGGETLEIIGVSTSCGCTTAEVDSHHLPPGETTGLTVTYHPQAHGGETGEFTRVVYVRSSDPETPEVTLTIRVRVRS